MNDIVPVRSHMAVDSFDSNYNPMCFVERCMIADIQHTVAAAGSGAGVDFVLAAAADFAPAGEAVGQDNFVVGIGSGCKSL